MVLIDATELWVLLGTYWEMVFSSENWINTVSQVVTVFEAVKLMEILLTMKLQKELQSSQVALGSLSLRLKKWFWLML